MCVKRLDAALVYRMPPALQQIPISFTLSGRAYIKSIQCETIISGCRFLKAISMHNPESADRVGLE